MSERGEQRPTGGSDVEQPYDYSQILDALEEARTGSTPARDKDHRRGILDRFRTMPLALRRTMIATLAAASIGVHVQEKRGERRDLEIYESNLSTMLAELKPLEERSERLVQLFGDHLSPELHIKPQVDQYAEIQEENREALDSFSWLRPAQRYYAEPLESHTASTESLAERTPVPSITVSGIKTTDRWWDDQNQVHEREMHIDQETMQQLLNETFPAEWVQGEVSAVTQESEPLIMAAEYGLPQDSEAIASCTSTPGEPESSIVFHGASLKESAGSNLDTLTHELAHANDWERDNTMTTEQRINLLTAIADRLASESRYQSPYVESITNEDGQLEQYLKAQEYWAEICREYFISPDGLHIDDFTIVDGALRQQDPQFSGEAASQKQLEILLSLQTEPNDD